ncbi:hypothetical protein HU002_12990 [Staphylococcus sp. SS251]|nr:hypothetical protein [Staphylococcus singaporensis]MBE5679375.1 hypothetical protein [Staphylococcus singaporensis]
MKRKLFIVSMGVIFVTQLMHSSNAKAMITESVETNFVVKDQDINKILQTQTEITTEQQIIVKEYTQKNKLKSLSSDNIIEYDLHTNQAGGKSGMLYGYSEMYSSHFTDRDKRAIRRDHVKEAQSLINDYKYTHNYEDLAKATAKVNTLGESHQKYLNNQIDKVNNQIEKTEKR